MKNARFESRDQMPLVKIYECYFGNSGIHFELFNRLWIEAAEILKVDPLRLRPDDRFDSELAPVAGSLVEDEIIDLEDYFFMLCDSLKIPESRRQIPKTMEDFILMIGYNWSDDGSNV